MKHHRVEEPDLRDEHLAVRSILTRIITDMATGCRSGFEISGRTTRDAQPARSERIEGRDPRVYRVSMEF